MLYTEMKGMFHNIAVVRASALGDLIFALPALTALRETFPFAFITLLGKKWHKEFFSKRESPIDRVIVIPSIAGVGREEAYTNDLSSLESFYKDIKKERFDLAIQLHGGGRYSNTFLNKLGASYTIGTKTSEAENLSATIPYQYYQNEYLRWLEVVSLVGAKTPHIMPVLNITKEDIAEARELLGENDKPYIVLHPGATDSKRRWPAKRFIQVGDYFAHKGFRIIVTGSGDEKNVVDTIVQTMQYPTDNFLDKLSLNGLVGLLHLSSLVISNDTGPLHLADALNCKTIGLYWGPNLINAAPTFRKKSFCLSSWIISCPLCQEDCVSEFPFIELPNTCEHKTSFVTGITVERVIEQAEYLLQSS